MALYLAQFANYLLPLITLPYLARVLGPTSFGSLAFMQGLVQYLTVVVEYGFNLSGTREVARRRGDQDALARILAEVTGAKAFLSALTLFVVPPLLSLTPRLRSDPALFLSGLFWAIAAGLNPMWFFQGLERMLLVALLEVGAKGVGVALAFLFVHSPQDAWLFFLFQGIGSTLSSTTALVLALSETGVRCPTPRGIVLALRSGFPLFFFRAVVSLYTTGNSFLLGLFLPPDQVAYYAGAERLVRALLGLVEPASRALLPRFSYVLAHEPREALRLLNRVMLVMGCLGALGMVLTQVSAPLAVRILLGPEYETAIPLMRILALLLPLVALSNVLGVQWMLPLGRDRAFNTVVLLGSVLNLVLALLLVPRYGALGMAWGLVVVEGWVTGGMIVYLRLQGLLPLGGRA